MTAWAREVGATGRAAWVMWRPGCLPLLLGAAFAVLTLVTRLPWSALFLVLMVVTVMCTHVRVTGYRPLSEEEHQRLRARTLTHLTQQAPTGDHLLVAKCHRWGGVPLRHRWWNIAPWTWPPAVFLWASDPTTDAVVANVARTRRGHQVLVAGADLPDRGQVLIRDHDGALAVLTDLPITSHGPVSAS